MPLPARSAQTLGVMKDHTTAIIASYLLLGVALALVLGSALRSKRRWADAIGSPILALLLTIGVAFGAGFTQEFCHKTLRLCFGTSDTNVWNFVLYPILSFPIYWIVIAM